ncbi:MAG: beta-ketoacyl-[acyl-carrier-protein] synthase family protein [Planctomycetota bacterium]|nr:beta-ketoacyl-[acyl-carrier-protein] synthase family protein [Planctomycetota bacterium]
MPAEETPVAITGVGPVSAIGVGREVFWTALTEGRSGIGPATMCCVKDSPSKIAAEVDAFDLDDHVDRGRVLARRMPRSVQFALAATQLALDDAFWSPSPYEPSRVGVVVGTSVANLNEVLRATEIADETGVLPAHAAFNLFNHAAACIIAARFDLRGPVRTTSCGCNSGLDAIACAAGMIRADEADAVLAVGTDCELVPEVFAALNASGSLATRYNDTPEIGSRPFDVDRDGNVLGEGAAALLLEREPAARGRRAPVYARFGGYRICAAGRRRRYDPRDPDTDPGPCTQAFRTLLGSLRWTPESVHAISANGSSSINYDALEGRALAAVFGRHLERLPIHSTKSMLGQHGAGSSSLQATAVVLSLHAQRLPPTINCDTPDPACGSLCLSAEAASRPLGRILAHAIGFGGFYYSVGAFEAVNRRRPHGPPAAGSAATRNVPA